MLAGVFTALLTPFTPDGSSVDEQRLRDLVEEQIQAGISGLVACGSTAEFATMTSDERKQVVATVCSAAAGRVPVIAQTGSPSTAVAIELSRHAKEQGAAALLLAAPYYGPVDDDDIVDYHREVSEAVDLPIMAYNFPVASGVPLSLDLMARLASEVPAVTMVKDSAGDREQLLQLAEHTIDGLELWCGDEGLVGTALEAGTRCFILGAGNVAPAGLVAALHAAEEGDQERLASSLAALKPLFDALDRGPYTALVKLGAEFLSGSPVGPVRRPQKRADEQSAQHMKQVVADLQG